ncbi:hypothetical protein E1286_09320 [Nonomuraea terrae]|uniref:Uncharacterized protein n=1 Tax=Nonomuraea terrae TaxID=2530383 RepID=A0A4R4Z215_9ACTN|nr:hypothetical protein [Nonomuraea terrae]TDD52031.1 hypothetical protein E1286_09320 [Nonomuraea terrae]
MENGTVLAVLSAAERGQVLLALLEAHPDLVPEAEEIGRRMLGSGDWTAVAQDVSAALRGLRLSDLAERAGPQWGGGYVDLRVAAWELLDEVMRPYREDLARRVRAGASQAALEIGLGLLAGLYACREDRACEPALVQAGMPDVIDFQADRLRRTLKEHRLEVPGDWLGEHCAKWS